MSAESETSSNVTAEAMNGDGATPLVSVIVPVYGVERYLDACVEGLVGQTYRNLEILLVDDGSPDRCPAMCDAWTARDERIRVIHKANGGLSDARNVGLAKATGDYIYFVDSDDMVERNLVERAMATMRDYDADLVMFQFDTISEDGKPLTSSYKHNHYDDVIIMTPVEAIKAQVKAEIDGYFWSFVASASIYRNHGFSFPVGRKIEDMARICNVIGESHRVVRIPEALYHYRMRRGSITGDWSMQLTRDWVRATDDRETYIVERFPELKNFMKLQQLIFFVNLDYETIRQSLVAKFSIDPQDADRIRRRIEGLTKDVAGAGDEVPESTQSLLDTMKQTFAEMVEPDAGAEAGQAADGREPDREPGRKREKAYSRKRRRYDFYVAGPFFNPEQVASMERLEHVLDTHGKTMFRPRFASDIAEVGPAGCFDDDVNGICASKAVIANLMDEDSGTMFEIGFAHSLGIPVYAYREGLRDGDSINLMIAQSVHAVFSSSDDLARYLETGEHKDADYAQF